MYSYDGLNNLLKAKNIKKSELTELLEEGSQADIVEKAARERLGYVYSDEVIYIDISGN